VRADAGPAQARQRHLDAAFLRVAGALVHCAAADVVAVLGQVGEVAEIGEGADHAHRLSPDSDFSSDLSARSASWSASRRKATDSLRMRSTRSKVSTPFLLADHVAEDAAQQADVLDQRAFVLLGAPRGRLLGGRRGAPGGGSGMLASTSPSRGYKQVDQE
jgi:hypothetical protein